MIDRFFDQILPSGVLAFGEGISRSEIDVFIDAWKESIDDFSFVLILAGSRTAEVKGISAAGATNESRRYTAVADAELLLNGPSFKRIWPLPPLPAGVSPALIGYVASRFLRATPMIIASGLLQTPPFPHLVFDSPLQGPSNCLSTGKAMDIKRVRCLWRKGLEMGMNLKKPLLLTECVPSGTTSAFAVLRGLGLDVANFVSGSVRNPPVELKKRLVGDGLSKLIKQGQFSIENLLAAVGDPFQPVALGLLLGARVAGQPVLLGGGSQMLAVLAMALEEISIDKRSEFMKEVAIGTTSWLVNESLDKEHLKKSFVHLMKIVSNHFNVKIMGLASGLSFVDTTYEGLRAYENGFIKEGVGAGALSLLAQLKGVSKEDLQKSCEKAILNLNTHMLNEGVQIAGK